MTEPKSIKRIHNNYLLEAFAVLLKHLEKKRGKAVEVRRLFHGTSAQFIDAICEQGFDWRVAGSSNATLYGKGTYFARDASYSSQYTEDCNQMFLAKVCVCFYMVISGFISRV